jgi:hypothetical protein
MFYYLTIKGFNEIIDDKVRNIVKGIFLQIKNYEKEYGIKIWLIAQDNAKKV